jgi:hypothetical protein
MQRRKASDPLWWVHRDFKNKAVEFDGILDFPDGSLQLVDRREPTQDPPSPVSIEHGEFSSLGALLFMINGHRPGPICGFYLVVEVKKKGVWCVGQMHADSITPLRVFVDALYGSEEEARQAAERMRLLDWGNSPPRMS